MQRFTRVQWWIPLILLSSATTFADPGIVNYGELTGRGEANPIDAVILIVLFIIAIVAGTYEIFGEIRAYRAQRRDGAS